MSDYRLIIRAAGGPELIEREDIAPAEPRPGDVRLRHTAIGLNFIDTYHRSGLYPLDLPSGLGQEAAGVVEAVGEGVTDLRPGDRVAYAGGPIGAYSTVRLLPASILVPLPDGISDEIAAAIMLKGMTAWMLAEPCSKIQPGETALVHAAAGGVGSLLAQWLKSIGVTVIAHSGSPDKADKAKQLGADYALDLPFDRLAQRVKELTEGRGVNVVFDGIGAASWTASLDALAPRGLMVTYGNASGPVPPFAPLELSKRGSLFLTRPTLFSYTATPAELKTAAERLFCLVLDGKLSIEIGQRFRLAEAADAHRALEERKTTGSTILLP
jgi:NADPH2:quinone reductase